MLIVFCENAIFTAGISRPPLSSHHIAMIICITMGWQIIMLIVFEKKIMRTWNQNLDFPIHGNNWSKLQETTTLKARFAENTTLHIFDRKHHG